MHQVFDWDSPGTDVAHTRLEHIDDLNRWAHEVKAYATDFEQVQEKLKQQIVRKPKQQPTPPTKFYRGIIKKWCGPCQVDTKKI